MTEKTQKSDAALEPFLQAARSNAPPPPQHLTARILADAAREMPRPAASGTVRGWRALIANIGGWPAVAGFAAASAAGVWLGFAAPDLVFGSGGDAAFDLTDLMPGYAAAAMF